MRSWDELLLNRFFTILLFGPCPHGMAISEPSIAALSMFNDVNGFPDLRATRFKYSTKIQNSSHPLTDL